MGWMNEIGSLAGQFGQTEQAAQGGDQAKAAGGLMQALEQHPGGIQGVLDSFRQNGMAEHVEGWTSGQQPTATPEQIQQGLGNTGLIEKAAQHSGLSTEAVTIAMSTLLPMALHHFAPGGQPAPQGQFGGLAQQLLSRFL